MLKTDKQDVTQRLAHIQAQLLQASGRDPLITPSSLVVTLDDEALHISGMVPHAAAKRRIGEIARKLAPDLPIDNSCVIDAMDVPNDSVLADRAGEWLRTTFGDDAKTMGILISGGKAYLRGAWPNVASVQAAQDVIGQYPGIADVDPSGATMRHVTNLPDIGDMPLDDIAVINQLEAELTQAGYRLGDWVNARIAHGRLTLTGVVDTDDAHLKVVEIASRIKGVRRIIDELVTRSGATSRDQMVEQRIRQAWTLAKVSAPDLMIFFSGGQAFVGGTVDTPEAKESALHLVHQEPAVRQVIDFVRIVTRRSRPA